MTRCAPVRVLNAMIQCKDLVITSNIAYGPESHLKLDVYQPLVGANLPVVVFFYGGSWRRGAKSNYLFVAATLARQGVVVVVPDYRLYPRVTFPDFLLDCALAVRWAQTNGSHYGSCGAVFLMGHSAGAYNAVMLGLDPAWLRKAGADPARLEGVIGLAGPYDFLPITNPKVVPIFPHAGPETQPITYAARGRPSLLLATGDADTEVKPRNTAALAARVAAMGGKVETRRYKGIGHIGLLTAMAPPFQWRAPVRRDVLAFIHARHLSTRPLACQSLHPGNPSPLPANRAEQDGMSLV